MALKPIGIEDDNTFPGRVGTALSDHARAAVTSNLAAKTSYSDFHRENERHQGTTVLPVSYFYPDYYATPGTSQWDKMGDAVPTVQWVMLNPSNGPGTAANTDFQAQLKRAVGNGLKVMGYISTVYATRPQTEVHAEVAQYLEWYPQISGIFLDEAVNGWSDQAGLEVYYQELRDWFTQNYPKLVLINNPGATTTPAMVPTADIMMSFENSAESYLATADTDINQNHYLEAPKNKFWHAIYNVTDEATALQVIEKASRLHVGHIYLTDRTLASNPWGGLPSQWLWDLQLKEYGVHKDFAPVEHNHDDRYYTENEVDTALTYKADKTSFQTIPRAEYEALTPKDPTVYYFVTE